MILARDQELWLLSATKPEVHKVIAEDMAASVYQRLRAA